MIKNLTLWIAKQEYTISMCLVVIVVFLALKYETYKSYIIGCAATFAVLISLCCIIEAVAVYRSGKQGIPVRAILSISLTLILFMALYML